MDIIRYPNPNSAFDIAKDLISRAPVLSLYDRHREVTLEKDACEYGLGTALIQEEHFLPNAEILAVVHDLEKYHHYMHERKGNVLTDHKPLESFFQKSLVKTLKWPQNSLLRAQH